MNDKDLRDCFAMFALNGYISKMACNPRDHGDICDAGENNAEAIARASYLFADAMLEARSKDNEEVELGIAAFKPKKRIIKKDNGGRSI
jgi:hypothetical protein